ncbi:unnamed protein product [Psylliodes chrysocephalus]|uniref:Large ribosomal subunit protein uL22 n=1 Tax=Psylliodes chrysocephalus TaxID=3402493 RepID=A0A9P0GGP9_9CUCU|nr:unnamed protein product [Psylliodes chrysocephala]
MGKRSSHHYSLKGIDTSGTELIKAKASNIPVKFKNLVEVAGAIRKMTLPRADAYLKNVVKREECVPFKHFKRGIGKCAQAKQFNTVIGRWPIKAIQCVRDLLRNATANCEYFGKDPSEFYIYHVQVNPAPVSTRRTYRAHGRITPYIRYNSHVQLILKEQEQK